MTRMSARLLLGARLSLAAPLLLGPWLFGAWEFWWFWPLAACLLLATTLWGLSLLGRPESAGAIPPAAGWLIALWLPFFVYAACRWPQARVIMDAQRSFLLFALPALVALLTAATLDARWRDALYRLLLVNLLCLGVYGLVNHILTGSHFVLWAPGYPQYLAEHRASGSYFCPDHFAGIMEIGLALALGLLAATDRDRRWKAFAATLGALGAAGVVLSKSRGGGLTLLVIGAGAWLMAPWAWSRRWRWPARVALLSLAAIALFAFARSDHSYLKRFRQSFLPTELTRAEQGGIAWSAIRDQAWQRFLADSRGRMIMGALRAWRSAPVWGIGPGMHQHLWPHFAASDDGDRDLGIRPTFMNDTFHSYEVHSDWVQLLEEYGIVGLVLFGLGALATAGALVWRAWRAGAVLRGRRGMGRERHPPDFAIGLGAALAALAMAFHSLGDFNLQMPATGWILGALLALGLTGRSAAQP